MPDGSKTKRLNYPCLPRNPERDQAADKLELAVRTIEAARIGGIAGRRLLRAARKRAGR